MSQTLSELDGEIAVVLRRRLRNLQFILCLLTTAVRELGRRKSELNEDIACVLSKAARDPLSVDIDELEALLARENRVATGDSVQDVRISMYVALVQAGLARKEEALATLEHQASPPTA